MGFSLPFSPPVLAARAGVTLTSKGDRSQPLLYPGRWTSSSQRLLVSKSGRGIARCREQKPVSPGEQNILSLRQSATERHLHWLSQFSEGSSGYRLPGLGDCSAVSNGQAVPLPGTAPTNSVNTCGKLFSFLFCAR